MRQEERRTMPGASVPSSGTDDGEGAWARPIPAKLGEMTVALVLLAVGLFFVWQSALLDFGRVGLPGPGFFPFALGVVLTLFAGVILYHAWSAERGGEAVFLGHRDVVVALLAMAGLAAVFERLDSYLALGLFTAVVLLLIARAAVWRVVLGATLGMVAVWLFFGLALGVRLPVGEFWQPVTDLFSAAPPPSQEE
jgi:putative tricarboxylic transport membrane protein